MAPAVFAAGGLPEGGAVQLLSGRVQVTAAVTRRADGGPGGYDAVLTLRHGAECFGLTTRLSSSASAADAVAELRRSVGWKGPYLFVATQCAGGNHWRCRLEEVFRIHRGRLVAMGALGGRDDADLPIGACYRGGYFHDLDADWEASDVTSHANAPWIAVVLKDDNGRLVADLARTWAASRPLYRHNDSLWKSSRASPASSVDDAGRVGALFANAILATYCRRPHELAETMAEAGRTFDQETREDVPEILAAIQPGALPRRSRSEARPCTGAAARPAKTRAR